jgi:acetyl-CoA carboxylase biotin carboxyl carrier protein
MDLEELKKLVALMNKNDLVEIEIESEGSKVRLKKASPEIRMAQMAPIQHYAPAPYQEAPPAVSHHVPGGGKSHAPVVEGTSVTFNSPMVGTFYTCPSPGADVFVKVGDKVGPKTIVCIIEAMKVMNQIPAEREGEILEVLVGNGEAVEYGQPLFTIRPLK